MMIVITCLAICIAIYCCVTKITSDTFVKQENKKLLELNKQIATENNELFVKKAELEQETKNLIQARQELFAEQTREHQRLKEIQENVQITLKNQTELSDKAYDNYCDILLKSYEEKEQEYNDSIKLLEDSYSNLQLSFIKDAEQKKENINAEIALLNSDLDKIRATRDAAQSAILREKEIKEKISFYCLQISAGDLADVTRLESIKPSLNKPRVLSMLIWSTFFQKPMNALCNNILGFKPITGIYKITNQKNGMCYIGQAVNISNRWKEHAKHGLDIDTPAGNKLYQAMKEDGITSFSWELLEECPAAQLNEKEKYYINLYQSYEFGYNSTKGNN